MILVFGLSRRMIGINPVTIGGDIKSQPYHRYAHTLRVIDNHHFSLDRTGPVGDSIFSLAISLPVFVVVPRRPSLKKLLFVIMKTRVGGRHSLKNVVELPLRNVENCRVS